MFARYEIGIKDLIVNSGGTINIPITMNFTPVDQAEVLKKDFISSEINAAINPIEDYEKIRFTPLYSGLTSTIIPKISYNVNLIDTTTGLVTGNKLSDAGFVKDDIKFKRNKLKKSFLRLNFYDSPFLANQNLLFYITIFMKVRPEFYLISGSDVSIRNLDDIQLNFIVENPLTNSNGFAEGYYIYFFKDLVTNDLPYELYMRAEFNNAVDGVATNMMTTNVPQIVTDYVNKIFIKYKLKKTNNGYYYIIDDTYSDNVVSSSSEVIVNLYQVNVI